MNRKVKSYKDSLCFCQFDLRVIVTGLFNRNKFFVVKLKNLFEDDKVLPNNTLLEILPLYTIGREDGIFVKKHLQNYNNVHSLLIPNELATDIKRTWNRVVDEHYLIAFIKTGLDSTKLFESMDRFYFSFLLIPGDTIVTCANVTSVYFKPVRNTLSMATVKVPRKLVHELRCNMIVQVDHLYWRSYLLIDQKIKEQLQQRTTPQEGMSVLKCKLARANSQRRETSLEVQPSTSYASKNCDFNGDANIEDDALILNQLFEDDCEDFFASPSLSTSTNYGGNCKTNIPKPQAKCSGTQVLPETRVQPVKPLGRNTLAPTRSQNKSPGSSRSVSSLGHQNPFAVDTSNHLASNDISQFIIRNSVRFSGPTDNRSGVGKAAKPTISRVNRFSPGNANRPTASSSANRSASNANRSTASNANRSNASSNANKSTASNANRSTTTFRSNECARNRPKFSAGRFNWFFRERASSSAGSNIGKTVSKLSSRVITGLVNSPRMLIAPEPRKYRTLGFRNRYKKSCARRSWDKYEDISSGSLNAKPVKPVSLPTKPINHDSNTRKAYVLPLRREAFKSRNVENVSPPRSVENISGVNPDYHGRINHPPLLITDELHFDIDLY